jgi:hypothetical protein
MAEQDNVTVKEKDNCGCVWADVVRRLTSREFVAFIFYLLLVALNKPCKLMIDAQILWGIAVMVAAFGGFRGYAKLKGSGLMEILTSKFNVPYTDLIKAKDKPTT